MKLICVATPRGQMHGGRIRRQVGERPSDKEAKRVLACSAMGYPIA
jgi:hypothetical protein